MIRVKMPAPALNYDGDVRVPGEAFLATNPRPTGKEWRSNKYWSKIHDPLYDALSGICSYCASFTPRRQSASSINHTSIDHFVPKTKDPSLAYEWSNFRLCRAKLNHRKGEHDDVLDPYVLAEGWFRFNFTTFELYPDPDLSDDDKKKVNATIVRFELNEDDNLVQERLRAVYAYADGKLTREQLTRLYPLIASEMVAQDFDVKHLPRFRRLLENPRVRDGLGI